jgi:aspartyl-tRNA(Asn)/glutamyl-tRNA(Gln) amidotransferase subunit C
MLSNEEVKHIATLARIGLSDEEVKRYQTDLSQTLNFFKELEALDTSDMSDRGVPEKENDYREDREEDFGSLGKRSILENVPETKEGYVKVKSVY